MPLIVHTAIAGIDDPDVLIISRKFNEKRATEGFPDGHRGVAIHFCPSKRLQAARWKRCRFNLEHEAPEEWELYEREYIAEMRLSYKSARWAWDQLLTWDRVVLVSNDEDAQRSARTVLGQVILGSLGAKYTGEL